MHLSRLLTLATSRQGERVALGGRADGLSFTRLARRAAGGATVLREQAAGHAVLLARNGPVMPQLLFAAARAGIAFTPVNYRLSATHIRGLLADLDAPLVVADDDYLPIVAGEHRAMAGTEFVAACDAAEPAPESDFPDDKPAVMLFTSGTTSKPKIVLLRHRHLTSYILQNVGHGSAEDGDAALVSMPPYHIAAVASVLSNLYAGRRVVYLPDFTAEAWLELARRERVTSAMVVPTMLSRVVEHLGTGSAGVPSLRTLLYGGSRMPRSLLARALVAFDGVGFVNAYGMTETSSTISLLGPDDHRTALVAGDESVRARLGSVGLPVQGIELQIRGGDGAVLGPDEPGELWVRGPQVSGEYVGRGSVLDAGGWFPTRDRAWLDSEGYLFVEGRSDDTIIRGGENIAPAEIEETLVAHPEVADAAVIGVPDDEWGERILAVVVRRAGSEVDERELRDWARSRLRGSRTPDHVVWRDELPRNEAGKLVRRDLVADVTGSTTG
ncbi:class I adenylate-forming enzyme family protein [Actinomadura rugatobispora]|uniref:Class I adenylate-forming enzyme family protein n=1 Tax=Actinomadura rugatobispora TaxID=1994 RepID=A0ABW1ADV9_9ACTN|nr:fatty acid--CoA ligase family protein [Actinomadura rugatobispora]